MNNNHLREMNPMETHDGGINGEGKSVGSKAEFIRRIGIEPDLAEFLTEFTEKPEDFVSMPLDRYREIECRMDAVISSLGRSYRSNR